MMNKRQAKKRRKKVVYPLVDEFNLLTLNEDEYNKAIEDYHNFCSKHYSYKHYKDRYKLLLRKPCFYRFPVGEATKNYMGQTLKLTRTRSFPLTIFETNKRTILILFE